jgi:C1A family cysteine protease
LRAGFLPIIDQGSLGSCTGCAWAAAYAYTLHQQGVGIYPVSRLFIYYEERKREHTVRSDAGATIRDGIKVLAQTGAPPETLWPYVIPKFTRKPPKVAYAAAATHRAITYLRVEPTTEALRGCVADGYPVVIGFAVYPSFESEQVARTGIGHLPQPGEALLGGHAVVVVGYDDLTQRFVLRNSWGEGWGDQGYFTLPMNYLTDPNLAGDFWTIRAVA